MAESDDVMAVLTCEMCKNLYQDPRVLPCQHTFCLKCMESRKNDFMCPTCKTRCKGVMFSALPKNSMANSMLEIYKKKPKPAPVAAVRTPVANAPPPYAEKVGIPNAPVLGLTCEQHTDERLKLYCVNHSKLICLMCKVVGSHVNCTVKEIDPAYNEIKQRVIFTTKQAEAELAVINQERETVKNLMDKIKVENEHRRTKVANKMDEMISILRERKQFMINQLSTDTQQKHNKLENVDSNLDTKSKLLTDVISRGNQDYMGSKEQYILDSSKFFEKYGTYQRQRLSVGQFQQQTVTDPNTTQIERMMKLLTVKP